MLLPVFNQHKVSPGLAIADNNIQYAFDMTDRSNNTSDKMTDIFSIDQTAPIINVEFDSPAGNDAYYRENRTATITVIERNFGKCDR